jgi:uncharacterized protein YcbK (DUF882 family)
LLGRAALAIFILVCLNHGIANGAPTSILRPGIGAKVKGAPKAQVKKKLPRYAPIELFQVNTKETLKLRLYDELGKPIKGIQKRIDRFLRCHKTGKVRRIHPRLPKLLYQTSRYFNGRRIEVVSGYRHPKVARNPKSPHKLGLACDFRVVGVPNAVLRDYLRQTFDHVGVGFYPNSTFIHLDVRDGPRAFWIDYSGPGEAANYAASPREDLQNGRADSKLSAEKLDRHESMDDIEDATKILPLKRQRQLYSNPFVD